MFQLIKSILPKEEKFFDLFEAHAAKAIEAAASLRAIVEGGESVPENCRRLARQEEEADRISYEVLLAIRRSFITPFDRSDIKALSTALDDAIDQMNKTAKTVMLYDVRSFEPNMQAMADLIIRLARLTAEALPLMRRMVPNSARLHQLSGEIAEIEEQSDQLNDAGLRTLYTGRAREDPLSFIVGSQLYDHLEKVCDRFEDVAHVMSDIVIEHA